MIITLPASRELFTLPPHLPPRSCPFPDSLLHYYIANPSKSDDYNRDIVDPTLKITLSILNAAHRNSSIKRVVITSSAVTLISYAWMFGPPPAAPDQTLYTAADINSDSSGPYSTAMEAYFAAKTLSRIATRKFMEEEQPEFEVVNLLPTVVFGPDELATNTKELVSGGNTLALGPLLYPDFSQVMGATVHIDDVARAHIDALKLSVSGNKDYILSSNAPGGFNWEESKGYIRRSFPEAVDNGILRLDACEKGRRAWRLDTSDTEENFGWSFITFEETLRGVVGQYLHLLEMEKK